MPELPEVETIKRGVAKFVLGKKIAGVKVNLPKIINVPVRQFTRAVRGARFKKIDRRAKIIIITLSNGYVLGVHLKLSGQLLYRKKTDPVKKHTHVIFSLNNGHQLRFWDLRQFGYVKLMKADEVDRVLKLDEFGPEPLTKDFTLDVFKERLSRRPKTKIKPLLLDQKFVAGIGNIYADEILFFSKVNPLRPAGRLKEREVWKMFQGIKKILAKAVREKGTSVDLYVDASGRPGRYVNYLKAYGREDEPCVRCRRKIKRIKIGARSASFCPRCQK